MQPPSSFGRWLKLRRLALELTQRDLGNLVGCAATTIRKIEADERRPSRQLAERLAGHLAIPVDEQIAFIKAARATRASSTLSHPAPSAAQAPLQMTRHVHQHLPTTTRPLIGREHELATVQELLLRDTVQLVTLTGAGGVGKTQLALAVAAALIAPPANRGVQEDEGHRGEAMFLHGVYFVDLAPIRDPQLMAMTIAQTLGVREDVEQPLVDALLAFLRPKRLLLLLDNLEHLLDAAPLVTHLLDAASGLKILATSRAALRLSGEHEFTVPPLECPPDSLASLPALRADTAGLLRYAAIRLFVERAQAVAHAVALTDADLLAVASICRRLDGLPLAIELAAARTKVVSPAALLALLEPRLSLLTGSPRDAPLRHQALRATLDWSNNLLSEDEQSLFAKLAVFVGSFSLEAATAVCIEDSTPPHDVFDTVAALVGHSLLQRDARSDSEPRFRMLETIREYALERLAERGGEAALRRRHAAYFLALTEEAAPELRGPHQKAWLARLERDHDNLRAALTWCWGTPEGTEFGLRLCGALIWFWFMRGNYGEARGWLDGAVSRSAAAADQLPPGVRARAIHGAAWAAENQSDLVQAIVLFEESIALYRRASDQAGLAEALVDLGVALDIVGNHERSTRVKEEGLVIYRELGNSYGVATALLFLTDTALIQGDFALATAQSQQALARFSELGAGDDVAWALRNLGRIARAQGDFAGARLALEESLARFRALENWNGIAEVLLELGGTLRLQGDHRQARERYGEGLALFANVLGKRASAIACLAGLAGVNARSSQLERAARLFGAAEGQREALGLAIQPIAPEFSMHDLAAVRAEIDGAVFAAAWAEGQAMTLEEAIAYALLRT
jgi:predicted ATPase/transcriptional regulator with XRE-family HTH domain